ncbi:hypothetical protein, partial [Streptomyces sp.]|uniref:hypothetical protein n=1 Tax=Streptomyces sp. TaxID=1931 RepID=UPI0028124DC0
MGADRAPRPGSSKPATAAMALVWALCLVFAVVSYFIFQIEYHGFFGSRRGPMDPAVTALTVAGMVAGVVVPAAVSYAVLRAWRQVAAAA